MSSRELILQSISILTSQAKAFAELGLTTEHTKETILALSHALHYVRMHKHGKTNREKILSVLRKKPRTVYQIESELELGIETIRRHLRIMHGRDVYVHAYEIHGPRPVKVFGLGVEEDAVYVPKRRARKALIDRKLPQKGIY